MRFCKNRQASKDNTQELEGQGHSAQNQQRPYPNEPLPVQLLWLPEKSCMVIVNTVTLNTMSTISMKNRTKA